MDVMSGTNTARLVKANVDSLNALEAKHEITLTKPLTTSALANIVGCKDEYTALFKFMSKYVHPTSWLVNRSPGVTQSDEYRDILLITAQLYAVDSYERTRKALGLPSDI